VDRTPLQGLPYPLGLDYANGARQIQDLAEALEAKLNRLDSEWASRLSPPSWLVRTNSNTATASFVFIEAIGEAVPGITQVWHAVDWDTGPSKAPVNTGSTTTGQLALGPGYETWYVGAYVMISGTTTLGEQIGARLVIREVDPVTNVARETYLQKTGRVTLNSGDHLNVDGVVRVQNARIQLWTGADGAGTKVVQQPSLMWATRIGREV
jgi:hypothetical protein